MSVESEFTVSTTRSDSATAADREFWIIVAFCTVGFAATMYLFNHLPLLSSQILPG